MDVPSFTIFVINSASATATATATASVSVSASAMIIAIAALEVFWARPSLNESCLDPAVSVLIGLVPVASDSRLARM